jgi:two-component system chemotaxis response regulator CheB
VTNDDGDLSPVGLAVVGASAGGVEALTAFAGRLPADLECPVVVVLHVSSTSTSALPSILGRAGVLPSLAAADGDELRPGHRYVAPPDCHVMVTPAGLRLSRGPRENGHRPALDPTMRSAAQTFDGRTVGIVLSGTQDDGTAGLAAIKAHGGRALVQDPEEALYPGMPQSAMANLPLDGVLPVAELARWLTRAAGGAERGEALAPPPPLEGALFTGDAPSDAGTRFTCPDCGGGIYEVAGSGVTHLQCSVGHAYSPESFTAEHGRELERALSTASRTLDDRAVLLERMAVRAKGNGQPRSAADFERQAHAAREHALVIRQSMQRFDDSQMVVAESEHGSAAR